MNEDIQKLFNSYFSTALPALSSRLILLGILVRAQYEGKIVHDQELSWGTCAELNIGGHSYFIFCVSKDQLKNGTITYKEKCGA